MKKIQNRVEPLVCSVETAGRLLRLSRATAYAQCRTGRIPTVRFGRALRVPLAALERMLEVDSRKDE